MRISDLDDYLGKATARDVLTALGIAKLQSASRRVLPIAVTSLLKSCLNDALVGDLRRLHAQARVLDFLVSLADHASDPIDRNIRQQSRIERVRKELERSVHRPPDLAELARQHGFTMRALNEGFKQATGLTVYGYASNLRLEAAHAALRETDSPLKVVAARLGYASVSHFSQAFTRKFGYRPGSLRRRTKQEIDDE